MHQEFKTMQYLWNVKIATIEDFEARIRSGKFQDQRESAFAESLGERGWFSAKLHKGFGFCPVSEEE